MFESYIIHIIHTRMHVLIYFWNKFCFALGFQYRFNHDYRFSKVSILRFERENFNERKFQLYSKIILITFTDVKKFDRKW